MTDNELVIFAEEPPHQPHSQQNSAWKILLVDDDTQIHAVTTLALSGVTLHQRTLSFIHAYSGEEALEILNHHDDIALILLDVVMENDDSGLRVAKAIREELGNDEVRIVLRTGQPGFAPEEKIVLQYDINDYKTKTELTRAKLLTTVISALRSYQQIRIINENRRGLEKIVKSAANLLEQHSIYNFSEGVVIQLASLLGLQPEGLVCVRREDSTQPAIVVGAAGQLAVTMQQPLIHVPDARIRLGIEQCLARREHVFNDEAKIFYIHARGMDAAAYIATAESLSETNHQLVELFLANISIGFENIRLFEELRTAAYRDTLTGLANRTEFIHQLDQAVAGTSDFTLAITDISHFSDVNDALGQDVGNKLIQAVGQRLAEVFDEPVLVARISADVFGLLTTAEGITPDSLNQAFMSPFTVDEHRIPISMTTGFSRQHQASEGLDVLKQAYIALKNAKNHRLDNYAFYHPSMREETERRLELVRRLRSDFDKERLEVWYQPQVELASGKVTGAEALLRWPQADGSFISPEIFIPLAEYSGLILDIGLWVAEQACQAMRTLDALVDAEFKMAINVSVSQFRQPDFADKLLQTMQRFTVSPRSIELEITESIVMDDPKLVTRVLDTLKSYGVGVAIDDFGVGFSSLGYVQRLPLDKLKIDRTFVRAAHTNSGAVIIETIINMGHRLGLQTLAEGIETEEQARYFEQLRVGQAQGFYFARPMRLNDLIQYMTETASPASA